MTRRARSARIVGAIMAIAAGVALAGCIGQVSAHPIGHAAQDPAPTLATAPAGRPSLRVATASDDRALDGVEYAAYLVTDVLAASSEAAPFVCPIMDRGAGGDASNETGAPRGTEFDARREAFLAAAP